MNIFPKNNIISVWNAVILLHITSSVQSGIIAHYSVLFLFRHLKCYFLVLENGHFCEKCLFLSAEKWHFGCQIKKKLTPM